MALCTVSYDHQFATVTEVFFLGFDLLQWHYIAKEKNKSEVKNHEKTFFLREMAFVRSKLSSSVYLLNLFVMSLITRVVMLLKRLQRSIVRGEQGGRSGESTHLSPMWPGFEPRRWRHMWVEFVVGSLSCSERLFSGFSGFPLSLKTKISKFQFDLERTDTFQRIECSMGKQITNNNKLPRKFF